MEPAITISQFSELPSKILKAAMAAFVFAIDGVYLSGAGYRTWTDDLLITNQDQQTHGN